MCEHSSISQYLVIHQILLLAFSKFAEGKKEPFQQGKCLTNFQSAIEKRTPLFAGAINQPFGTVTALCPIWNRKTDVGRVCASVQVNSTDTMALRFARGWLEEGEDLQLILNLSRCLF